MHIALFAAFVALSGCSTSRIALQPASTFSGTYTWGDTVAPLRIALAEPDARGAMDADLTAEFEGESDTFRIRLEPTDTLGSYTGHTQIEGDAYRVHVIVGQERVVATFDRQEYGEWLDEGHFEAERTVMP